MTHERQAARAQLPADTVQLFDDIVDYRVLGASKHIEMIGEMLRSVARDILANSDTTAQLVARCATVTDFFKVTRGESSQAIVNAVDLMTSRFPEYLDLPTHKAVEATITDLDRYFHNARYASDLVVANAVRLLADIDSLLVFDYSSTVDQILATADTVEVYVAESRVINGGAPFLETCQQVGHRIHFIPDAGLLHFADQYQAVLMGAETFYPDGTGFNTIGADLVGLVCASKGIPLYIATPCVKLDRRPLTGVRKPPVMTTLKDKVIELFPDHVELDSIDYTTPELVAMPPQHITGYVTEYGVVPPTAMFTVAAAYLNGHDPVQGLL